MSNIYRLERLLDGLSQQYREKSSSRPTHLSKSRIIPDEPSDEIMLFDENSNRVKKYRITKIEETKKLKPVANVIAQPLLQPITNNNYNLPTTTFFIAAPKSQGDSQKPEAQPQQYFALQNHPVPSLNHNQYRLGEPAINQHPKIAQQLRSDAVSITKADAHSFTNQTRQAPQGQTQQSITEQPKEQNQNQRVRQQSPEGVTQTKFQPVYHEIQPNDQKPITPHIEQTTHLLNVQKELALPSPIKNSQGNSIHSSNPQSSLQIIPEIKSRDQIPHDDLQDLIHRYKAQLQTRVQEPALSEQSHYSYITTEQHLSRQQSTPFQKLEGIKRSISQDDELPQPCKLDELNINLEQALRFDQSDIQIPQLPLSSHRSSYLDDKLIEQISKERVSPPKPQVANVVSPENVKATLPPSIAQAGFSAKSNAIPLQPHLMEVAQPQKQTTVLPQPQPTADMNLNDSVANGIKFSFKPMMGSVVEQPKLRKRIFS